MPDMAKTQSIMTDINASPTSSSGHHVHTHRSASSPRKAINGSHSTAIKGSECPFIIEFVMVEGINFKCMAYLDKNETWRNAYNNAELIEPVRVLG
jgi:hypothetical protein